MSSREQSFLDGTEWVLRTRVSRKNEQGLTLTHDASIHARPETRARWNAHFWSLYPESPGELRAAAARGEIMVSIMFRFRPTAKLKERYHGHPVLQVARAADAWRDRIEQMPQNWVAAVDDYERDKRRLDEQRRRAWRDLLQLRLPTPPAGYFWDLESGDPRAYSDLLQFRLKPR